VLGEAVVAALQRIADTLELDYAGTDFAVRTLLLGRSVTL
jgi:hypothetical protein